jgi:hypothetical protein
VRAAPVAMAIVALLCAAAAWAEDAGAVRRKAKPGQLGSPKEDEEPTPGAPAAGFQGSQEDSALLRGLLYAFEPAPEEIRVIAVEDLALLGDARALNALALLIFDPNTAVQTAAVRAVGQFQSPRAEEILENVVRHPRIPDPMKIRALQELPYQASKTCREFLNDAATSARMSASVRSAARQVLQDLQPPFAPKVPITPGGADVSSPQSPTSSSH